MALTPDTKYDYLMFDHFFLNPRFVIFYNTKAFASIPTFLRERPRPPLKLFFAPLFIRILQAISQRLDPISLAGGPQPYASSSDTALHYCGSIPQ